MEFLLRVEPTMDGAYRASCAQAVAIDTDGPSFTATASTAIAAMVAALINATLPTATREAA